MSFDTWLAYSAMDLVLCFVPGPAVLFVVSVALARGARPGLAAALGIVAMNAVFFALSGTGVAAVILASHRLFTALQWAGAAYLVWTGLRMLRSRAAPVATPAPQPVSRAFARGLVVQGANPKALIFFLAMVPPFIDPHGDVPGQIVILGVTSVVIELPVLAFYVACAVQARRVAGARMTGALERVGGAFLVAAGLRLAAVKRN